MPALNEAVCRKRGSGSSDRQCEFASFVARIKFSGSRYYAKPPTRCMQGVGGSADKIIETKLN
jgi:hypothetical protein